MRVIVAVLVLIGFPYSANAEVGPFGVSVGVSTANGVKQALKGKASLTDAGTNQWSEGAMLRTTGENLGIDQLRGVVFIFDKDDRLVGVVLDLPKYRYEAITEVLRSNYAVTREVSPFVGDRMITFRQGDVEIRASAPHLSFDMSLEYIHNDLRAAMDAGQIKKQEAQRDREKSAL